MKFNHYNIWGNTLLVLISIKMILSFGLIEGFSYDYSQQNKTIDFLIILSCIAPIAANIEFAILNYFRILTSLFLFGVIVLASSMYNNSNVGEGIVRLVKLTQPFLVYLSLIIVVNKSSFKIENWAKIIIGLSILLATVGLFFLPSVKIGYDFRAPAFFSNLHTSAYVLSGAFLISYSLFNRKKVTFKYMLIISLLTWFFIFQEWQVRTAMVSLVAFFMTILYRKGGAHRVLLLAAALTSMLLPVFFVAVGLLHLPNFHKVMLFSSGRLSMWSEKLTMFFDANIFQKLIGRGPGADYIVSEIWWWDTKNSHNDYLLVLTDYGLSGLVVFIIFLTGIYFHGKDSTVGIGISVFIVISSALSNGPIFRPLASLLMMLALVICNSYPQKSVRDVN